MKAYRKIYNKFFSHIYVEKEAFKYELAKKIIKKLPLSSIIEINHYKDVFCRTNQSFEIQKKSPCLILAVKHNNIIYKGADMCQNFGNENFYYASSVMNCVYDCEYCYLRGMYPSANIVIFVNTEDFLSETEKLLEKSDVYMCVSYDTDMAGIEGLAGNVKMWLDFAKGRDNFRAEIRTKSASHFENIPENIIFAFTLSPEYVADNFEHGCPSLRARIENIKHFSAPVRLCFDPLIYLDNFEKIYGDFFDCVFSEIDSSKILDISVGTFRISSDYVKTARKHSRSGIMHYPFLSENGISGYGKEKSKYMTDFALKKISEHIDYEKIFVWGD